MKFDWWWRLFALAIAFGWIPIFLGNILGGFREFRSAAMGAVSFWGWNVMPFCTVIAFAILIYKLFFTGVTRPNR